jgi:hypothetical protein
MDDHKPVMISILFSKHGKDASFFFPKKIGYFNTGFVFYNIKIQPDIMQNW